MNALIEDEDPVVLARDLWSYASYSLRRARRAWKCGDRVEMARAIAARIDVMQRACALDPQLESRRRPHQRVGDLDLDDAPAVVALLRSVALQQAGRAKRLIDEGDPKMAHAWVAHLLIKEIEDFLRIADVYEARAEGRSAQAE